MADLKRYTAQVPLGEGCLVSIEGPEHNHIANVMRHQKGDKVILLNGDGYDYTAEIIAITKKRAQLQVLSKEKNHRHTHIRLAMLCALLKGDAGDWQAVKLSELGAHLLIPFVSKNCVVRGGSNRAERLRRAALESSKQCKRAVPMEVTEIMGFNVALDSVEDYNIKIIAYEGERKATLKEALSGVERGISVAVAIGPEGGFAEEEVSLALQKGFKPVTLGKTVLKADTAAIAAASAILFEAGEWAFE